MRFLADSHVLVWWLSAPDRLSATVREAIEDGENQVLVSVGSVWEIELKRAKGKLQMPGNYTELLQAEGFEFLDIELAHVREAASLPAIHSDPFDRLLVAQAKREGLVILSRDEMLPRYKVPVLEA